MRNKVTVSRIALLCAMLGIPAFAFAGTTGTEFLALYTWINGVVTGYLGRAIAMASVAIGALMSVAKSNPIPILVGIGLRFSCNTRQRSSPARPRRSEETL